MGLPTTANGDPVVTRRRVAATLFAAFLTLACAPLFRPSLLAFMIWYLFLEALYIAAWPIIRRCEFLNSKITRDFRHDQPDYYIYRLVSFTIVFVAWGASLAIADKNISIL